MSEERAAVRSLYLHIPFCERRCEYCDFVSMAGREREAEYMAALVAEVRELARRVGGLELDTVFVGGGTPSFVDPGRLGDLLDSVRAGFVLTPGCEVTLEANPSSTGGAPRPALARSRLHPGEPRHPEPGAGHPRLSPRPGPRRRPGTAAVAEVRRAGFTRVSCDLIYAVPGLDDARWQSTFERVIAWTPTTSPPTS